MFILKKVAMMNADLRKGSESGRGASCALACMIEDHG